jgi:beta-phosphoglucomutase-like phosphatase (HAD superfamily)
VIIFDCNGVLVDSEQIATSVAAEEFTRIGIPLTPPLVSQFFFGRRPDDMFAMVEAASGRKLPASFASGVAAVTLRRLRAELRSMPHAAYALTWLRGPKCVASSSSPDRIRASLEATGLGPIFRAHLFRKHRGGRQTRPRSFSTCSRTNGGDTARLYRGRGFTGRGDRRNSRGHDRNRVRRGEPCRGRSERTAD